MEAKFHQIKPLNSLNELLPFLEQEALPGVTNSLPLFHYTSSSALQGIIENEELWLSKSELLNDKLELKYTLDLVLELVENFLSEKPAEEETLFKKWIQQSIEQIFYSIDVYTLSLSTNKDSNLLWSNYASNEGYNIEFRYPETMQVLIETIKNQHPDKDIFVFSYYVIYDQKQQIDYLRKEIVQLYQFFLHTFFNGDQEKYKDYKNKMIANIVTYSIFFKDSSFSQEEEFRIAVCFSNAEEGKAISKCRLSKGVFIPYIALPITTTEKQLLIKSVTIGPKNSLDIAEQGLRHFLDINSLESTVIAKSKIPYRY